MGKRDPKSVRLCVVCGAKVRNQNPKTVTCDPVCTAARKAGRTRPEQLRYEMDQHGWEPEKQIPL
jgi:hypothetical protein